MSDSPYQVLGVGVPSMLGRERLFEKLCRHLIKSTPDHMCVVGPPLYGKSVLLNHLAFHFRNPGEHYGASMYCNFRHRTPSTDEQFRKRFAEGVKDALESVLPELAKDLDPTESELSALLHLVFRVLQ